MSTLFVNTIKPDSGSNILISSSLTISESLTVAGDFILSGSIILGDTDTDSIGFVADISSSIIPDANQIYNLGSTAKQWDKIHVKTITASGDISSSGTIVGAIGDFDELNFSSFINISASGDISTSGAFIGDGSQLSGIGISGSALDVINISSSGNISSSATGSFQHLVVSGDVSGSISASGTGSFQGGIDATGASGSFGYILTTGDISASGNLFSRDLTTSRDIVSNRNVTATGNISSSGTGSFEHLIISSQVNSNISASGTGSFMGGIDAADATGSFGYISSSGDISASGDVYANNITIVGNVSFPGNILTDISASGIISASGFVADGNTSSSFGYISASGDISTSNGTGSFTHLAVSGSGSMTYLFVSASDQLLPAISCSGGISASYFSGDGRHLENVTASFVAGGTTAAGSDKQIQFNDNGALGAESGIEYATGSLFLSSSLVLNTNSTPGLGHVSASRVSASAGFEADTLSTSSFGFISCSGNISSSGTGSFAGGINCISPGDDGVNATGSFGYISCSGDISLSGEINGVDGTFTTTVSGSTIKGQQIQAQQGDSLGFRFNLNDDSQVNALRYKVISTVGHAEINALPLTVTKDISSSANLLIGGTSELGGTLGVTGSSTFNGTLNMAGAFQIGGIAVTATSAELNKMDGFLGTTSQLNTLIKTSEAAIEDNKPVKYDEGGAIVTKQPIIESTKALEPGESNTLLLPTGSAAQTYTLPEVAESKGVKFEFMAGSSQAHIIQSSAGNIFGQIIDNSNGEVFIRTELESITRITLANAKIGDRITIISDGSRYFVEGRTNDTPALA